jgi:hypothetical protein
MREQEREGVEIRGRGRACERKLNAPAFPHTAGEADTHIARQMLRTVLRMCPPSTAWCSARAAEGDGGQEPLVDPGVVDDDDEALVGGHVQRRLHPLVEVVARS